MPKLTLNYFKFPATSGPNIFEAARKHGDVQKGDLVRLTGVNAKGLFSVDLPNGKPSEHWHPLDLFYPNLGPEAANDDTQK